MILPEDPKAPLPSDDEGEYEAEHPPAPQPYRDYPVSSSPRSGATQPLLSDEADAELGPAPPYTSSGPLPRWSSEKQGKGRVGKWIKVAMYVAAVWALIVFGMMIATRLFGRVHGGGKGHGGPHHEFGAEDGEVRDCANFHGVSWTSFPSFESAPHLPQGPHDGTERRSSNVTFLLPTGTEKGLFAHLTGQAAIGNIFVSKYDAQDEGIYEDDTKDGRAIEGGVTVKKGEYVRVVVEPILDVPTGQDVDEETNDGFKILDASKVCLVSRKENRTLSGVGGHKKRRQGPEREDVGVSIFTRRPDDVPHHDQTPLQFRIYDSIPTYLAEPFISTEFASISIPNRGPFKPRKAPSHHIKQLEIRGGVSGIYLDRLYGSAIGDLSLDTAVGDIQVEGVRAEGVQLRTSSQISGYAEVSNALDLDTSVGKIDFLFTLASPPEYADITKEHRPDAASLVDFAPGPAVLGQIDVCNLPPVQVSLRTASGSATIRNVGWEDACRGLALEAHTEVGSVEVHAHPLFQGAYRLHTKLGDITVDIPKDTKDPLEQGRHRDITLSKSDRLGSRLYQGQATWRKGNYEDMESDGLSDFESQALGYWLDDARAFRPQGHPHPPPPPDEPRRENGIEVNTSVGDIQLVF